MAHAVLIRSAWPLADDFRPGKAPVYDERSLGKPVSQLGTEAGRQVLALGDGPVVGHRAGCVSVSPGVEENCALWESVGSAAQWCLSTDPVLLRRRPDIIGCIWIRLTMR